MAFDIGWCSLDGLSLPTSVIYEPSTYTGTNSVAPLAWLYFGVINSSYHTWTTLVWSKSWTPGTSPTESYTLQQPYSVGVGTNNGARLQGYYPVYDNGILKIEAFMDGVAADHYLTLTFSGTGPYDNVAWNRVANTTPPTPAFWTKFVNTYEIPNG